MRPKIFVGVTSLIVLLNGRVLSSDTPRALKPLEDLRVITFHNRPVTESLYSQSEVKELIALPFSTEYQDSDDLELGQSRVVQEGREGKLIKTFRVAFWDGEVQGRELVSVEEITAVPEIILRGTRIVPRTLETPLGELTYYLKKSVYATSYDGNCPGCRGLTYSGTEVKRGVCAVDPRDIPLGTQMYVEGYGLCHAEDVGGAIKGNRVDLGFEDVSQGFWSAKWTNVYLLLD